MKKKVEYILEYTDLKQQCDSPHYYFERLKVPLKTTAYIVDQRKITDCI